MEDDEELAKIGQLYSSGEMLTGEIKNILASLLIDMVTRHQQARAAVTENVVDAFMTVRDMTSCIS